MRKERQRGLTLLETLVALVILAGAFTAALAMMRTAERLNLIAQHRQERVDNAYGLSHLRALLEGLAPVVRHAEGGVPILDLSGNSNEVSFFSAHFAAADRPPLKRTTVKIADGAISLLRADDASEPRNLIKLDRASRFRFGEIGPDGALVMRDDWIDRPRPPIVIIIEQEGASGGARQVLMAAYPRISPDF